MEKENKKHRNPNAFPTPECTAHEYNENGHAIGLQEGMTLRDYFATKALQGIISKYGFSISLSKSVSESYVIADEMLKQREL